MESLFQPPYIVRVLISLGVILAVNKLTKQLLVSILAGMLVLGLWSGHSAPALLSITWGRLSAINTIFIQLIVIQIIWLSGQMAESGSMQRMVDLAKKALSRRLALAVLPAVIGLLPMPGGAAFSAPLVEACDENNSLPNPLKTRINFWFRHIWEYWWPLYPGVLLATEISGLSIPIFMLLLLPLSLSAMAAGWFFLLRNVPPQSRAPVKKRPKGSEVFFTVLPVFTVPAVYGLLALLYPASTRLSRYVPLVIGIMCAQLVLQMQRPINFSKWKPLIISGKTLNLVVLVSAILCYGAFIEAELPDGTLLISRMRQELDAWRVPLALVIMVTAFIPGLTTGLALGFVGAGMPVAVSLLGPHPALNDLLAAVVLAYGSGYAGMMLSPVHVCLVLTNRHFNTSLFKSILGLAIPSACVTAVALAMYILLSG
jgi:integral membrane protein (TIGR00529 family)